jgi:tight adherence protein B
MITLMILVFLASLALFIMALYFLIEAPATNRTLAKRLESVREVSTALHLNRESELLRGDVLSRVPTFQRILSRFPVFIRLNLFLRQAGSKISVGMLLMFSAWLFISALFIGYLFDMAVPLDLLLSIAVASIPTVVIAIKRRRRLAKFEEQFPDAIDLLARAVRAGHAFTTGLDLIGSELSDPIAEEFRFTFEQQNLGLPLGDALKNLLGRVPIPDMHVFVTGLLIQRESGGNLAEILDSLSSVIRDRFKLARQVKVFTAQGRMSLYILTGLPPLTALMLYLLKPEYTSRLFTHPMGQRFVAGALILQVLGYLVIRKIIQPKI